MQLTLNGQLLEFIEVPLIHKQSGICDVFAKKINKTVGETLLHRRYQHLSQSIKIIKARSDILLDFELPPGWQKYWEVYRMRAIHPDNEPLSKQEVTEFLEFVEPLSKRLSELRQAR